MLFRSETLALSITNLGQAPVRLPVPTLICSDSYRGTVNLHVRLLRRSHDGPYGPGREKGCGGGLYDVPRGQERLKEWRTLKQQQSLTLELPTDPSYHFPELGDYEYSVVYYPPDMNASEKQLLIDNHEGLPAQITSNVCIVKLG